MKKIGDKMGFTGGAETTPMVEVVKYSCPGSMHDGDITLRIVQDRYWLQSVPFQLHMMGAITEQVVILSPGTLKAILKWYEGE